LRTRITPLTISLFVLALTMAAPTRVAAQIILVVPARSTVDSLSLRQVRSLFKGRQPESLGNELIQLVEYAPSADEFYGILYHLDSHAIGKLWLRLIFAGARVRPIKSFSGPEKFLKFVATTENALGFISSRYIRRASGDSLKTVSIDGHHFTDKDYPLARRKANGKQRE